MPSLHDYPAELDAALAQDGTRLFTDPFQYVAFRHLHVREQTVEEFYCYAQNVAHSISGTSCADFPISQNQSVN